MATAEIIAIGTELLLGEIQDTNTSHIARHLRDAGIDLYRTTIIGDNEIRIAQAIQEAMLRSQIVITTGGLGPTVDDPTRQAVALAMGVKNEFQAELWEQIEERFQRFGRRATENNRRQAFIPQGAQAIENPVGTAPAFIFDTGEKVIISLPGVPREMEYLLHERVLPLLKQRFKINDTIRAYVLHIAGVGESLVDEWVGDMEMMSNPTVGLLAHPGQIDIRVTAKGASAPEIDRVIQETVNQIRQRVGENVYGENEDTLESVVMALLAQKGWSISIIECGLNGELTHRLRQATGEGVLIKASADICQAKQLPEAIEEIRRSQQTDLALGVDLQVAGQQSNLSLYLLTPGDQFDAYRSYGGPPQNSIIWAVNTALDFLRRHIGTSSKRV